MDSIPLLIVFLFCHLFVFGTLLYYHKHDKAIRGDIKNSDGYSYCFYLSTDLNGLINALALKNAGDPFDYTFDADNLIITFHNFGTNTDFQLSFFTFKETTYMRVKKVKYLEKEGNARYLINTFWIKKTGATPVDYKLFNTLEKQVRTQG